MALENKYQSISAGSEALHTTTGHIAAGQGKMAARTPLMLGADGNATKLVKWNGTPGKAVAITVGAVDATNTVTAPVYKTGCLNAELIAWPDNVLTLEAKRAGFLGTALSIEEVK